MLKNVRLFCVMEEFDQYRGPTFVSGPQFKKSFTKLVEEEVISRSETNQNELSEN